MKKSKSSRNYSEGDGDADSMDSGETVDIRSSIRKEKKSKSKDKKKKKRIQSSSDEEEDNNSRNVGYQHHHQIREIDLSEVPPHIFSNLIKVNPANLENNGALSTEDINSDEVEGWIIQCPQSVDLRRVLRGQKISLNGSPSTLSPNDEKYDIVNGQTDNTNCIVYETVAVKKEENVFLILSDGESRFKMVSAPLNGYITVRRHIEDSVPPTVIVPKKRSNKKLPKNIKERHPIYGIDFSEALSKVRVTRSRNTQNVENTTTKMGYEDDVSSDFVQKLSFSKSKKKSVSTTTTNQNEPSPTKKRRKLPPAPPPPILRNVEPIPSWPVSPSPKKSMRMPENEVEDVTSRKKKRASTKSIANVFAEPFLRPFSTNNVQPPPALPSPEKVKKAKTKTSKSQYTSNGFEATDMEETDNPPKKSKKSKSVDEPELDDVNNNNNNHVCEESTSKSKSKKKSNKRKHDLLEQEEQVDVDMSFSKKQLKNIKKEMEECIPTTEEIQSKLKRMKRSKSRDKDF